jgi:hypothetical protein
MNIKKIIREEIEKLNEEIQSDLVLPKGKRIVLQADNPEVNRGLIVTWLEDGGYDVEYWYKDPSKIYPAEVVIDGKPITKDGKVVHLGYHPEIDEGFGSSEFLSKTEKKKFEKERLENAEVLGYTLTGTKDIRESVNEADARNDKSIGTKNYKGVGWFWPSALWKHYLRDTSNRGRKVVHDFWLKAGFKVVTDKRGVPHFNIKPSQKNKAMKIVNAVEKRIPIKESVFAVNLDKEKNDERHPEQPNINYDPEKGKSRIRKIRENKSLITEATRWLVGVEMPNGQIVSTYGHWDGYPSYTGQLLKRYYSGGAGKVRDLIKLGKNGISTLDKSMKGGKGHSFNNPLPGETIFYGRDRGDKQRSMRKWRNRDSIKYNMGEEFAYIWSVKDRKWYVNDTDKDEWKVL